MLDCQTPRPGLDTDTSSPLPAGLLASSPHSLSKSVASWLYQPALSKRRSNYHRLTFGMTAAVQHILALYHLPYRRAFHKLRQGNTLKKRKNLLAQITP